MPLAHARIDLHRSQCASTCVRYVCYLPLRVVMRCFSCFFFSSRRRHTRYWRDWSSDVCSSDLLGRFRMHAYNFVDENKQRALYWRDVGTLEAYFEANMDVAGVSPIFNLYDKSWPMRPRPYQYPPAKFVFGEPGRTG